jgi:type IV fimbrial biogenesis protein FimT
MMRAMKSPTRPRSVRNAGFTLIELMTTVSVAGVLLAIAIPAFTNFVASSRLSEQTNELIGALNMGRSEAIKRNRNVIFCRVATGAATTCAGAGNWRFWILRTMGVGGTVLRRGVLDDHGGSVTVTSTLTSDQMIFGADGLSRTNGDLVNAADTDAHFIRICSSSLSTDNSRVLTLGASSRITITRETEECT